MLIYLFIFIVSFSALFYSSNFLVDSAIKLSKILGWKEFVVSFFLMAFAMTIPNLFIGVVAALNKVPELSFADVIGTNIVDFTLIVALGALISKSGLSAPSRTVQGSCIFTFLVALFPLLLIQDGVLSRIDGVLLLASFLAYLIWLFQKKERFEKVYDEPAGNFSLGFIFKNILLIVVSVFFIILAAQGIVKSAIFFTGYFNVPLTLIGILVIGLGTALPEISFTVQAARKSQDWLIFGDIMGSAIMTTTLVLGIVSLIHPIVISNFSPFSVARAFLIISALCFFFFTKSEKKITKKEAGFLLLLYILFVAVEILTH